LLWLFCAMNMLVYLDRGECSSLCSNMQSHARCNER
jgi:hypothetical protein